MNRKWTWTFFSILSGAILYCCICGYGDGPAYWGYDCTGAEPTNPTGCRTCHGNVLTPAITLAIEVDSAGGIPIRHYTGGMTYTVTLTGTNNTNYNLPKFGFQIGAIMDTIPSSSPADAGSWNAPYPANVRYIAPQPGNFLVGLVEHAQPLYPTSGSGANGTVYSKSFSWTAPPAGSGNISIWAVLNAVNGDGADSNADCWNIIHDVLREWQTGTAYPEIANNEILNAYPNPATDDFLLQMKNFSPGIYRLLISDESGREMSAKNISITSNDYIEKIYTLSWPSGIYYLSVQGSNFCKRLEVIRK